MEKRLLAAIVLSLVVLVSWQVFFMPEPVKTPPEREVSSSDIPSVMGSTNSDDYVDTPVLPTDGPRRGFISRIRHI